MSATDTLPDADDITIVGAHASIKIDSESMRSAANLLEQAAQKLGNSEKALELLSHSPPFSFGANFPFDLPTGDPATTWRRVERTVEGARFDPPALCAIKSETAALSHSLDQSTRLYEQQEAAISARFEQGKGIGKGIAKTLAQLAAERAASVVGTINPVTSHLVRFLGETVGNGLALITGDYAGWARGVIEVSTPLLQPIRKFVGEEDSVEVAQHVMDVFEGKALLGSKYSGEEFAAILFGIFEGVKENGADPIQLAARLSAFGIPPPVTLSAYLVVKKRIIDALVAADLYGLQDFSTTRIDEILGDGPPQNFVDLGQRVADQYPEGNDKLTAQIEIETLTHVDGTHTVIGYLPGMAHFGIHPTHPNDGKGNVQAVQGLETEQAEAMKRHLMELDVPVGTQLVLAGHSKGGMDALNLSMDPEIQVKFNVALTTTFGSPTELLDIDGTTVKGPQERDLPLGTEYVSFSHSEDVVPAFDMSPPVGRSNQTEVISDSAKVLDVDIPHAVGDAHEMTTYVETTRRVVGIKNPDLDRAKKVANEVLGGPGTTSKREVYRVEKEPPEPKK